MANAAVQGIAAISSIGETNTDVRLTVAHIITVALGAIGIILVCLLLVAGFLYLTAGGDDEKIALAKKLVINGIVGLVLVLSSYSIALFVTSHLQAATGQGGAVVSDANQLETVESAAPSTYGTPQPFSFTDGVSLQFSSGMYAGTRYDSIHDWIVLASSTSGTYTSAIKDGGSAQTWTSLSWVPGMVMNTALPDNGVSESGYAANNVSMASDTVLLHFDEPASTAVLATNNSQGPYTTSRTGNLGVYHDTSGNGNDAYCPALSRMCPVAGQSGIFGNAVALCSGRGYSCPSSFTDGFAGTTEPRLLDTASLEYIGAGMTLGLWLNLTDNRSQTFISKPWNSGGQYNYMLMTNGAGKLQGRLTGSGPGSMCSNFVSGTSCTGTGFATCCGAVVIATSANALPKNQWVYVAMTVSSTASTTTVSLYVNGASVGSASGPILSWVPVYGNGHGVVALGENFPYASPTGIATMDGYLDEFAFYTRILSPTELMGLYERGVTNLRFQVRSCPTATCSGVPFVGPGNNSTTYYAAPVLAPLSPPITVSLQGLPANEFFQYKAYFDTTDPTVSPQLLSVSASGHP